MAIERMNFFLLLDLDPSVEDTAAIEQRIEQKRQEWSRQAMGSPKAQLRARANLALLPELRLVLLDPDRRRREAQLARRLGDEARTKLLEGLDEAIVLLRASGEGWDESTIERLAKELSPLTAKEIRERLVAADLAPEGLDREKKRRRADRAGLDPTTLRKIRENLEHLRLANLYEFLALGPQSSPQALLARAEEKYLESLGRPKADADARAVNALSGLAKQAFASDQQKARYDQSLGLEAMVQLKPRLEDAGRDGFLAREEVNALLELARRRGVATEDALAYIEDYAATRKWRMQTDSQPLPAEELQLCGYCRALTRPGAERCPGCGELLEQPCPRCGASNPTSAAACLNCGSKVGDGPLVAGLLQEGERLALGGELVAALEHFERGLRYWPEWPPLVQARERAQQRLKAREMELAEVENLVGATRLVAAERALERFSRLYGAAGTQRLRERIERGLALASEIFAQAESLRAAGANAERVRAQLDRTLRACSDFEPALQAAAEMPLAAPSELVAERLSTGLRLRWKSVSDKETSGVTYRVLRKRQGMPLGPQDGVLVASVAGPPVDDVQAEAGVPWCYAVYSERSGVLSRTAALSGPHLRLLEVEALEVEPGDRSVLLRWRAPTGCIRVEVERQLVPAGPASSAAPSLLTSTAESAQDTRLQNGKTYAYRVVAVYPDPARPGSELRAAAVTVVATPVAPPAPVLDLRAERDGNRLRLRWSKVAEAWVEIRLSTSPVGLAAGTAVPLTSTASWGERLSAAGGEALETRLPGPGRFWLIPLSVRGRTAVVGASAEVVNLEAATHLEARRVGDGVALTWDWPRGAEKVVVAWAQEGFPQEPHTGPGRRVEVCRAEYDHAGSWLVPHLERRRHFFSVFVAVPGQDLFAPPATVVESGGQEAVAHYRVGTRRALLSRSVTDAWIEVSCKDGLAELPGLFVVAKPQAVPIATADGEIVVKLDSLPIREGQARIPLPSASQLQRCYLKLFFQDPSHARSIRLLPAASAQLRVV